MSLRSRQSPGPWADIDRSSNHLLICSEFTQRYALELGGFWPLRLGGATNPLGTRIVTLWTMVGNPGVTPHRIRFPDYGDQMSQFWLPMVSVSGRVVVTRPVMIHACRTQLKIRVPVRDSTPTAETYPASSSPEISRRLGNSALSGTARFRRGHSQEQPAWGHAPRPPNGPTPGDSCSSTRGDQQYSGSACW